MLKSYVKSKCGACSILLIIAVFSLYSPPSAFGVSLTNNPIIYRLFFEIDCLPGNIPTQSVLNYIEAYFLERMIRLTFFLDDSISLEGLTVLGISDEDYSNGINDTEFWKINEAYNDHKDSYYSDWKWILFGNLLEDDRDTFGQTSTVSGIGGIRAGNYIFIAKENADNYTGETSTIEDFEVEAVILMHEIGHSMGILKVDSYGNEVYDRDSSSVMSRLNPISCNAADEWGRPNWHYSDEYWALKYLDFYKIRPRLSILPLKCQPLEVFRKKNGVFY